MLYNVRLMKRIYVFTSNSYRGDEYIMKYIEWPHRPMLNVTLLLSNGETFFVESLTQEQSGSWVAHSSHRISYYNVRKFDKVVKAYLKKGWAIYKNLRGKKRILIG